jgi:lycopene beta-cyclase
VTYFQFHLVFTLPVIGFFLWLLRGLSPSERKHLWQGIGFVIVLALLYTSPWDNYLVYKGIWTYPPDRVLATIGFVPVEEYAFFVLMSVLTGLFTYWLMLQMDKSQAPSRAKLPRIAGTLICFIVGIAGSFLFSNDHSLYLALTLVWAAPVIALHWGYGGDWLWSRRLIWFLAISLPTLYLSAADLFAIRNGIWSISPVYTTGLTILGLPLEEGIFFMIANILVVQGTMTFWYTFQIPEEKKQKAP